MAISAPLFRDSNHEPIVTDGVVTRTTTTLTTNNATGDVPIFGITGTVEVRGLWGVVTTVLGANHTAASWRLNDQTAQVAITSAAGTALSAAAVGSTIVKKDVAANALTFINASAGRVSEPTTLETTYFSPFVVTQKTGAIATNIEYQFTTTDAPTSGVIQFFLRWLPISTNANVVAM